MRLNCARRNTLIEGVFRNRFNLWVLFEDFGGVIFRTGDQAKLMAMH